MTPEEFDSELRYPWPAIIAVVAIAIIVLAVACEATSGTPKDRDLEHVSWTCDLALEEEAFIRWTQKKRGKTPELMRIWLEAQYAAERARKQACFE